MTVDANILVSELSRSRGRALISRPELALYISSRALDEARHELARRFALRVRRGELSESAAATFLEESFVLVRNRLLEVPFAIYGSFEDAALRRIPRDPDDWHTVAAALLLDTAIWTNDGDFLGCGVATWTTETLLAQL